jgi:hypothetical protein
MKMVQNARVPPYWTGADIMPPYGATCIVCGGQRFATAGGGWNCVKCCRIEDPRFWKFTDTSRGRE